MAEQEHGLDLVAAGPKINPQMLAEFVSGMNANAAAQLTESRRQHRSHAVHRCLQVAGRFDFYQLTNGFYDSWLLLPKMAELLGGTGKAHEVGLFKRAG